MKVALLISTYNWPEALELIFQSIVIQTHLPDEILLADDGSGIETKNVIDSFKNKTSIPIKHVWQEDKGFRKTKIVNKAVAISEADYIIEIDGDCILHERFIEDHRNMAIENGFLYGSRVNIKSDYVEEVLKQKRISFGLFSKFIENRARNLYIPLFSGLYSIHNNISKVEKKIRGCNFSFWKKDFMDVNGYNEEFEGWGSEDHDLVYRMINNGCKCKRIRYAGIVYHIYHASESKDRLEGNNELREINKKNKVTYCRLGIDQYLK